jgi:hypothetical protein
VRVGGVIPHLVLATLLLAAAATASTPASSPAEPARRDVDLAASARPTELRRDDRDAAFAEEVVRGDQVKADAVATTTTACHGCHGESTTLQVLHLRRADAARLDNVASAWTQDCWDCTGTALSVQVVVVPKGSHARPNNRALAVDDACATCRTSTAAFQVVVEAASPGPLSDAAMAGLRSWFDEQAAVLRASVAGTSPRRSVRTATRAASVALADLRGMVVAGVGARAVASRVEVTR